MSPAENEDIGGDEAEGFSAATGWKELIRFDCLAGASGAAVLCFFVGWRLNPDATILRDRRVLLQGLLQLARRRRVASVINRVGEAAAERECENDEPSRCQSPTGPAKPDCS